MSQRSPLIAHCWQLVRRRFFVAEGCFTKADFLRSVVALVIAVIARWSGSDSWEDVVLNFNIILQCSAET